MSDRPFMVVIACRNANTGWLVLALGLEHVLDGAFRQGGERIVRRGGHGERAFILQRPMIRTAHAA